jgi:hypothetical protein
VILVVLLVTEYIDPIKIRFANVVRLVLRIALFENDPASRLDVFATSFVCVAELSSLLSSSRPAHATNSLPVR